MKITQIVSLTFIATLTFSCGAQYAKLKIDDARPADKYVYGDIDGPPRQLANKYPDATAETVKKASEFRANVVEAELVSGK
ncbi:MAG: hypothetical protein SFY32_01215 [Bacteroidota bacterium]|nr:hypothetical protein [Bacteroidota bacterium]